MNFTTLSFYTFIFILILVFSFIMYLNVKNRKAVKRKQQEEFNKKIREDTLKKFNQSRTPAQKYKPTYRRYVENEGLIDSGPDVVDVLIASEVLEAISPDKVELLEVTHTSRFVEEASLVQESSHSYHSSHSNYSSSSNDSSSSCDSCSCSCGD